MAKTKKSKGIALIALGIILLILAGVWYASNVVEDKKAGESAALLLSEFSSQEIESEEESDICGKIIIPALGKELPIYRQWSYEHLLEAPCRYAGSPSTNDMIIAGHNYESHFGGLKNLAIGEKIYFIDSKDRVYTYQVKELAVLDGTAVSDMTAGEWDFTLFTCTKGGKQRVTVRCEKK